MNLGYLLYQGEHTPDRAEQRAADAQRGELARILSGLLHPHRGPDRTGPATGAVVVPDYLPAEWVTTPK
ncbi:MAG TPA: hypothetical protein VMG38_10225 [Trebonia sp.]|nr:hypothetical protein [Trebonia sp.]